MAARSRKKEKKNKSFQIKTLVFLMIFFVLMGSVVLPNYFTQRFDEENKPEKPFFVAAQFSSDSTEPMVVEYSGFAHDADMTQLWRDDAEFPHQNLEGEVRKLADNMYDLNFKSEIFTVSYRYRIDDAKQAVLPVMYKVSGWIVWFYAIGCLIAATVLITVAQWLLFWWRTSFVQEK